MNKSFSEFEKLPLSTIEGIWPSHQRLLQIELGIISVGTLLNHVPIRYIDKTSYTKVNQLHPDIGMVQIKGVLKNVEIVGEKRTKRLRAFFEDDTGAIELVWFRALQWVQKAIVEGQSYVAYGKISSFNGTYSISHPELKQFNASLNQSQTEEGFEGIYPSTEKLKAARVDARFWGQSMLRALRHPNFNLPEFLPEYIRGKLNLPQRETAYSMIHFPKNMQEASVALDRFKFEEIFLFQLRNERTRLNRVLHSRGPIMLKPGYFFDAFYNHHLPFELTEAQKRVVKEIWVDMKKGIQMNRLLQGDVGSGKTVVAFFCMLLAIDNGFQTCLMAPTEILAQQHAESLQEWATPIGLKVALLTGSSTKREREEILGELETGTLTLLTGTHAVLEDKVKFQKLGLVIIDEQHRFGVAQRAKLWLKSTPSPHMLVMTATPIPRTLAMTAHGESDHSIIDQLPKGRKPIVTVHREEYQRMDIMFFLKSEVAKGRQIYFVFPLIEESAHLDIKNLMDGYDMVANYFPTPEFRIAIVHGRMKAEEKEKEMERFKSGVAHVLVATTVIEVGVNVPNASVMVIESAERFGLSQLHQLRGRVGRGAEQSYCILMTKQQLNYVAKERMNAMVQHTDGFEIAKIDLKQRGPGDMLGTKQSGLPDFKFIDLVRDEKWIFLARQAAKYVLKNDPKLELPENQMLKNYLVSHQADNFWSKIS